jgi:apolipoprotein N-acyltransferase
MTHRLTINDFLPWIAAAAGGILAFLGYAGFDHFYLEWICLVPVLWAIRGQGPARAFIIGWVAGIIGHGGGFYWIVCMFRQFAGLPWPPALLGLLLMGAANGIVFAVWAAATRFITGGAGWNVIWVSPVVWTALEKFWPEIFPNYLGASQYRLTPLTQIADVTGILGVTFLVVYVNSLIFAIIERRLEKKPFPFRPVAVFAAVIVLVLAYGTLRVYTVDKNASAAEKLTVGLVQTNRGGEEKYKDRDRFLREHIEMSRQLIAAGTIDLIVWPENTLTADLTSREGQLPPDVLGNLRTPILFGAISRINGDDGTRLYNSAVLVNGTGQIIGTYDKMTLVPLGEYIPLGETFPWLYSWSPYSSRFWPGENYEPLMLGAHPLSVSICYEDIFPGQIRKLMKGGRDGRIPDAMFNLTNDSWYGNTVEPMEHLVLASFRAIEQRRPLVRSTCTGISAIIDPVGRIARRSGQWTKETLAGQIPMMHGRTVYAILGDWAGWLCAILAFFGIGRAYQLIRRRSDSNRTFDRKAKKRDKRQRRV